MKSAAALRRQQQSRSERSIRDGEKKHDVNENNTCENIAERSRMSLLIDRAEKRAPRLYNIITVIVIPLIFLVVITIFCGHFLAVLESKNELNSLHDSMVSFMEERGEILSVVQAVENTYENCIDEYIKSNAHQSDRGIGLREFMNDCKSDGLKNAYDSTKKLDEMAKEDLIDGITLNWNICLMDVNEFNRTQLSMQNEYFGENWFESYNVVFYNESWQNTTYEDAHEAATKYAKDAIEDSCEVNSAGGAIFWFTIMTTIGYGNTSPVTNGGKMMIYTLGFISILVFTAMSSAAGYVCLVIADDFFVSVKLEKLTKGWMSVLFWFFILWLWILFLAEMYAIFDNAKYGAGSGSFTTLIWWAYISVTTVGLGDYHIPHHTFLMQDMFYIPLFMLMGFVFLANFLLKLSELAIRKMQETGFTDDESLHYLLKEQRLSMVSNDDNSAEHPSPRGSFEISSNLDHKRGKITDDETSLGNQDTDTDIDTVEKIIFTSRYERK